MLVACGGGGGGSQPPPPPPPTDTTAPVTALDNAPPALTIMTTITFSFSANEPSTFETRVDGAALATARNPQVITNLGDGSHTFEVRARDAAGNLDATPVSFTWVIDTTPPNTTVTALRPPPPPSMRPRSPSRALKQAAPSKRAWTGGQFARCRFRTRSAVSPMARTPFSSGARDAASNVDTTRPAQAGRSMPRPRKCDSSFLRATTTPTRPACPCAARRRILAA